MTLLKCIYYTCLSYKNMKRLFIYDNNMQRDDYLHTYIYFHRSENHGSTMQIPKVIIFYKRQAMYKIIQYFLHILCKKFLRLYVMYVTYPDT